MADIGDILGKKVHKDTEREVYEIDGMCGYIDEDKNFCFYPYVHSYFYPKTKKLQLECAMGHETVLDWEVNG